MTAPKLTQTLTIKPRFRKDDKDDKKIVALFDLKPIRRRIEQAINSFPRERRNILITVTTKKIGLTTVDITISMQAPSRPPDGGTPAHPPKREIIWQ
jgi:hypothetical protein